MRLTPELDNRYRALSHWVVVFLPGDYCESVPAVFDDGTRVTTAEEAAERAYSALEDQMRQGASDGGAELDELEALVFERGRETERFELRWTFEPMGVSQVSTWEPEADDEPEAT